MRVMDARRARPCAFIALGCLIVLTGCGEKESGAVKPNVPPETRLVVAPCAGDTVSYAVRMDWFGWDPDGEVTHYLARWDSLEWFATVETESVFVVETRPDRRDSLHDYRPHTFEIKAVDNDGAEDPTPESVAFTASNLHPDTEILSGPSGVVGAFAEFEWLGTDGDGSIAGYGYRLLRREGSDWVTVAADDSLGGDDTAILFGPIANHGIRHRFEVWAVDNQGAADRTPAAREFTPTSWGPALKIRTNVLGTYSFSGVDWDAPHDYPAMQVLSGEALAFDWSATPDVVGYRHAYDDTSVWPDWSLDDTHFEVAAEPGVRTLYVCAKDMGDRLVRGRIRLDVREATLADYILLVDDYDWLEQFPEWGTDADRSAFYDLLVAPFGARTEWNASEHTDSDGAMPPDVEALRRASTVVWYSDGRGTTLERLFETYPEYVPCYNALAGYARVGGNLVLCGFEPLREIVRQPYPIELAPQDSSGAAVFVRDVLGIDRAETSGLSANKDRPWDYGYCLYGAVPTDPGLFEPMYIDSLGKWWPIYGSPVENYSRGGLPMVEKLHSSSGNAVDVFEIDAFLNTEFDGQTCALMRLSGSDRGNVCYVGFPFYYLQTAGVEAFFGELLTRFGEERR